MDEGHISTLPEEILVKIRNYIAPEPEPTVEIYYRRFLSVESLDTTTTSPQAITNSRTSVRDIHRFRLVCKRFAKTGEETLFTHITVRPFRKGLEKLKELAGWDVARHVQRFSYMVTYSYPTAEIFIYSAGRHGVDSKTLDEFKQRLQEQKRIEKREDDVRVLTAAFKRFSSLQVVKLLRVSDDIDKKFEDYIKIHDGHGRWTDRYWAPSCTNGSRTIGKALLAANKSLPRYYMPAIHAGSLSQLYPATAPSLSQLAERLTCLTLVFEDGGDLDDNIRELSPLFRHVFAAARNMEAIHIGFKYRPFTHPIEDIFHYVTWNKLLAFGISGWCLHADEIINLAKRHREKLKGLRLREVFLKAESHWKEVLEALKANMEALDWLSLRGIGYVSNVASDTNGGGVEVGDDLDLSASTDSDDEMGNDQTNNLGDGVQNMNRHLDDEDLDSHGSSDEENGPGANETEFPQSILNQDDHVWSTPSHGVLQPTPEREVDLEDNGGLIDRRQRKAWEAWAVRRSR